MPGEIAKAFGSRFIIIPIVTIIPIVSTLLGSAVVEAARAHRLTPAGLTDLDAAVHRTGIGRISPALDQVMSGVEAPGLQIQSHHRVVTDHFEFIARAQLGDPTRRQTHRKGTT